MKPRIDNTSFGSITIDHITFKHDVIISLDGQVKKRKKKLSKAVYGTSHTISLEEAKHVYEKKAKSLIIGAGQYSRISLSDEAREFLKKQNCQVKLFSTKEAIEAWNKTKSGKTIGLFHITC
jgi:hypothetical protein